MAGDCYHWCAEIIVPIEAPSKEAAMDEIKSKWNETFGFTAFGHDFQDMIDPPEAMEILTVDEWFGT